MKSFYSDAFIINDSNFPDSEILEGEQKYVQITKVNPLTSKEYKDFNLEVKSKKDKSEMELAEKNKKIP